jgi:hypothetical protein
MPNSIAWLRRDRTAFADRLPGARTVRGMPGPEETFIVRVRPEEGDAVLEQPRRSRLRRVRDVSEVGPLIRRWLGQTPDPEEEEPCAPTRT